MDPKLLLPSSPSTMNVVITCKNKVCELSKLPSRYSKLLKLIERTFINELQPNWTLQYLDNDGDSVMVTTEEDYHSMLEYQSELASKLVQISIVPIGEKMPLKVLENCTESNNIPQKDMKEVLKHEEMPLEEEFKSKGREENLGTQRRSTKDKENRTEKGRKEEVNNMVMEFIYQNIPAIAELTENNDLQTSLMKVRPLEDLVIHAGIACNQCGIIPMTGVRYQCSKCENFNLCEKCEATTEHSHSFLKIKNPSQCPQLIMSILEEDKLTEEKIELLKSQIAAKVNHFSKQIQDQVYQTFNQLIEKLAKTSPQEEKKDKLSADVIQPEEVKSVKTNICNDDILLVKEISTIPVQITVNDRLIYKAISLKNIGTSAWPAGTILKNIGGVFGQDTKVVKVAPGEDFSCILTIENPAKPGDYESYWRLVYEDEKIGSPFIVNFTVVEPEPIKHKKEEKIFEAPIDLVFMKEICTMPSPITVEDQDIYKTISLRNSGREAWPANAFLKNVAGVRGKDTKLTQVNPGEQISSILILENPVIIGNYTSSWRLAYFEEENNMRFAGEIFTVIVRIGNLEIDGDNQKKYPEKMVEKAMRVKAMFPNVNVMDILGLIVEYPRITVSELAENYMAENNEVEPYQEFEEYEEHDSIDNI